MERSDDWAVEVIEAVHEFYSAFLNEFDQKTKGSDLTPALARMLWALDPAHGPLARRELAARLHCDPSNVTWQGDQLAALGLVIRVPDPSDRRVRALLLTPEGRAVRRQLAATVADVMKPGAALAEHLEQLRTRLG